MTRRTLCLLGLLLALASPAPAALLFNTNATWKLFKGRSEASSPDTTAWRNLLFNDSTWSSVPGPFWYGDVLNGGTQLSDMLNQYTTFYLRRTFVLTSLDDISGLRLGFACDDGFVAWINGVQLHRYNVPAGNLAYTAVASGAVPTDPAPFTTVDLANTGMLVVGTNVITIQVLNAASGSTDIIFSTSLSTIAPDLVPPTVIAASPAAGTVNQLNAITVTFNEPVSGVDAADLRINGVGATGLSGGNDSYTFTFPQPAYGTVNVNWAAGHGIADFGTPANPFNAAGPGATWQYTFVDNIAPTVALQLPFAGVTVRNLNQIQVNFSEAVTGVDAADLLVNASPATNVTALPGHQYLFKFPTPAVGTVEVSWTGNHNIRDLAAVPNAFVSVGWSYVLDPNAVVSAVRINEVMAANLNGLRDENNETQDWVELFNNSDSTVSLAGWVLTDDIDEEDKWVFPAVAIPARGHLIVFCSEKDRKPVTPGSRLHTNFKLNPDGEFIGLYNAEVPRQLVSSLNYPNQRGDYSYGYDLAEQLRYFQTPTPGVANPSSTITGVVADTKFSHDRGFYTNAFSLVITCATPGVTIRYTTNGTAPSAAEGAVYSSPILISRTTPLRAIAVKSGLLPSDVDCHTYLFTADVINQSTNGAPPPGWPAGWGANVVDYGMDPEIVNVAPSSGTIKQDLLSIPTFSIVMKLDDLFHPSTGIYANPGQDGIAWERPCSIELINPDDTEDFQINAGIRLRGGFSRSTSNPKHAFRFFFRQEYGESRLNYPFFGPTGASSFDKFDMRTMQNYSWSFGGDGSMMCLRDVSSRDAQLAMNGLGTRGNFFHLYINGIYWGLYNSEERPEAAFAESYVGGRADDYDVVKVEAGPYTINATDGNMDAWTRLWRAATNGFANDVDYFKVQGRNLDGTLNPAYENLLDVPNLIDYMLVILYGGNLDAPISNFLSNESPNNWYGFRDRSGQHGGFRFISHDAEHTLLSVSSDRTGPYNAGDPTKPSQQPASLALSKSNPQYIWSRLQANAEFRLAVADRVHKHCFNNGPLSTVGMRTLLNIRSNELQSAIVCESARWGDSKVATPFTRSHWLGAYNSVISSFVNGRTAIFISQLQADNLWPGLSAPVFNHRGGSVSNGFAFLMTNPNSGSTIYYTLDGTDPRLRGGAQAGSALAYTPGTPIVINYPALIRARVRSTGGTWSAIEEATLYPSQNFAGLLVTEIMYNPPAFGVTAGSELEFLELKNVGEIALDLSGLGFSSGIEYSFPYGTRLVPGQFLVLGRNATALQGRYPALTLQGIFGGLLNNAGETLEITNQLGAVMLSVDYKDGGRWPITADSQGYSLVPKFSNTNPNPNNPSNWRASTQPGGSPGSDDPTYGIPGIVINEALTHSVPPAVDYIEVFNPTGAEVDIGGWFLTDDPAVPRKFRIPSNTILGVNGFARFTETDFNPTPGTNSSFSLSSGGESVYLLSGDANANLTGYSHGFNFEAAPAGVTFGRHVISTGDERFVLQIAPTPDTVNSGPRVGPIVIRQIMYHPPDLPGDVDNAEDEYIELRNITGASVPVFDPAVPTNTWHLRGGVDFDFPMNVTVGPTQSLLLVSFNPTDPVKTSAFRNRYGGFIGVPLYGPFTGKLDNSSDTIEIKRPDLPGTNEVPYITVDLVDYRDSAPWSSGPDGSGAALARVNLQAYGDDPANWMSSAPLTINGINPPFLAVRAGTNAATATNVTFTVDAIGTGELSYQWRRDGINLPGETNVTLTITDVQVEDEAGYSVVVTDNSSSAVSQPAYLYLSVTVVFTLNPVNQTVPTGGTVILSGAIAGSPPPFNYEWRRISPGPSLTNFYTSNEKVSFHRYTAPATPGTQTWRLVVKSATTPVNGVAAPIVSVFVVADADGDGIPDAWETANGFDSNSALDANFDTDEDGMVNWQEYVAGTDPRDAASYLKVDQLEVNGPASISFAAVSNRTYTVQFSDNAGNPAWTKLADVVARSTNRVEVVTDPHPISSRIYRLATPQAP